MNYAFMSLVYFVFAATQLFAQQSNHQLDLIVGVNAGLLKSQVLGLRSQPSFGLSLSAWPHERVSIGLAVAHAATRTRASRQALTFIDAPGNNYRTTAIDFTSYLKCFSLNKNVGFYAGFGINQIWSDFLQISSVETDESSFEVLNVDWEEIEGARTSVLATFALRSNPAARIQVSMFGNIAILDTDPVRSNIQFVTTRANGRSTGQLVETVPSRYARAGLEVSYRIRK